MADKLKLAIYWAASCGGCEIAILEIGEKILKVAEIADIVFCPCIVDFKYDDVRGYADGFIDVCLFNGAIRNSEQKELAELLRKKSKVLVAYGSCSSFGGIPSLANYYDKEEIFHRAYEETESTENPGKIRPQTSFKMPEGELTLPKFFNTVFRLCDVVKVDYTMPGCPPTADQTWAVIEAIATGNLGTCTRYVSPDSHDLSPSHPDKSGDRSRSDLSPRYSETVPVTIGVGAKAVCDECPYEKKDTKISKFYRVHEKIPEEKQCLLEQGFVCVGPATRSGCGAQCLNARMPCRGCYGPLEGVFDQGAKMISAIGSRIDSEDPERSEKIISEIADPAGTFYRFGTANSKLLKKRN